MLSVAVSFSFVIVYLTSANLLMRRYRKRRIDLACQAEVLLADPTLGKSDKIVVDLFMRYLFSYEVAWLAARTMGKVAWKEIFSGSNSRSLSKMRQEREIDVFFLKAIMCILATNSLAAYLFANACISGMKLVYRIKHHTKMPLNVMIGAVKKVREGQLLVP